MSKTREDAIANPESPSFFNSPPEIKCAIVAAADNQQEYVSPAATDVMRQLSMTCKTMYNLFKPDLDKRDAEQLLIYILQPNETHIKKVIAIAQANPRLFFIQATAQDLAMDLEDNRRTIKSWSPYQALFGTGNSNLLANVKTHLDAYLASLTNTVIFNNKTYKNGYDLATQQIEEKFPDKPNRFDFPSCSDKFNQLVNALADAVSKDGQLQRKWDNPNNETLALLLHFREDLKPGIVETGHHYNMNDVIKTHEIDKQCWEAWTWGQIAFWRVFIIGFQERLMTAPYLDAACTGLNNHVNKNLPLKGDFNVKNYVTNKMITVVPLAAEDVSFRLGEVFFIDSYYGAAGGWAAAGVGEARLAGSLADFGKLCQANTAKLLDLMQQLTKQVASSCLIA